MISQLIRWTDILPIGRPISEGEEFIRGGLKYKWSEGVSKGNNLKIFADTVEGSPPASTNAKVDAANLSKASQIFPNSIQDLQVQNASTNEVISIVVFINFRLRLAYPRPPYVTYSHLLHYFKCNARNVQIQSKNMLQEKSGDEKTKKKQINRIFHFVFVK